MLMDPGDYFGKLVEAGTDTIGDKNTPLIYLTFEITHQGKDGAWYPLTQPTRRAVRWFLSDAAWPHTESKLRRIGFDGNFNVPNFDPDLSNTGAALQCTHQVYNNQSREQWDIAKDHKPPSEDTLGLLSARYQNNAPPKPLGSPPTATAQPKAQAPVPAATSPPPIAATTATREEGWTAFCEANAATENPLSDDRMPGYWIESLRKRFPGVSETDITGEQWAEVVQDAAEMMIPF